VHTCAFDRADADAIVAALPATSRLVVLSSQDVYRAFYTVNHGGDPLDAVPFDEHAPVRDVRYPYRGETGLRDIDPETYDKLDVEEVCATRGAVVMRLPMVYGEHDPKRREEFVLRRIRAGRRRIPIGDGSWLWSRAYVGDAATAVRAAIERSVSNEVLNIAERSTWCMAEWARRIALAAGADVEWVRVPDAMLPADLEMTSARKQHLLTDASRARTVLDWSPADPDDALRRSVRWHLSHPPADDSTSFEADDRALAIG
jgi:nucleoside-diphosphate-sugar epimerase